MVPLLMSNLAVLVPNDMKMLSFLAGELSNSAISFSTFADVSTDTMTKLQGLLEQMGGYCGSHGSLRTE